MGRSILLLAAALAAACRTGASAPPPAAPAAPPPAVRTVQPGAPGQSSRTAPAPPRQAPAHTAADVAFMQGMIGHHAQALEMVALLKTRTAREDMKLMGLRIEVSQADEIKLMQAWLRARNEAVPDEHALHMHDARLMPGMLTPEQMTKLSAASGAEFDRLFLEFMIQHHEGALVMVKELMSSPGAGQDSDLFAFAADVEADQSAEIHRMRAMRAAMGRIQLTTGN